MITVFNILPIAGLLFGTITGYVIGALLGDNAAVICGLFGGVGGYLCGRFSLPLTSWLLAHDPLKRKNVEQLHRTLQDPEFRNATSLLIELGVRGEDLAKELSLVVARLGSPNQEVRGRAWHALQVVYPSQAKLLRDSDFRVEDEPSECKKKADGLKKAEPCASPSGGPTASVDNSSGSKGPPTVS